MTGEYRIVSDRANGILTLTLSHFWSVSLLEDFARDVHEAASMLPCGLGRQRVIVDLTGFAIQSQSVFDAILEYLREAEPKPHRVAMLTGTGLARMQIRRSLDPAYMALFDTMIATRNWIMQN